MKNTFKTNSLILLVLSLMLSFTVSCRKENDRFRKGTRMKCSENEERGNRLIMTPHGLFKETVSMDGFKDFNQSAAFDESAKRGGTNIIVNGEMIAEGFSVSNFYVKFGAVINKNGTSGKIYWSGTDFGVDTLDVHYLSVQGNEAVVGGIVNADDWYFPKGYFICFKVKDNGTAKSGTYDQLNHHLFYSSTDNGTGLTPSSGFWSTGWYQLNSQVKIK